MSREFHFVILIMEVEFITGTNSGGMWAFIFDAMCDSGGQGTWRNRA